MMYRASSSSSSSSHGHVKHMSPCQNMVSQSSGGNRHVFQYMTIYNRNNRAQKIVLEAYALEFGECVIPHPDKISYGGEDAYFVSAHCFGVSDGVGGWQESGINPAEYSQTLMEEAKLYFEGQRDVVAAADGVIDDSGEVAEVMISSLGALSAAHTRTRKPGSATACIIRVDEERGELEASNLGDSGFVIVRDGRVHFKSPIQEHFFDCPYQLGAAPEYVPETDYPSDAMQFREQLQSGDVIVLATDGLWDNVAVDSLLDIVNSGVDDVQGVATRLGELAAEKAQDEEYESPYALEARQAGIELSFWDKLSNAKMTSNGFEIGQVTGGKLDDITILVAKVSTV